MDESGNKKKLKLFGTISCGHGTDLAHIQIVLVIKHQCHLCNRMMTKTKSKYLAEVISENSDNPRRLLYMELYK